MPETQSRRKSARISRLEARVTPDQKLLFERAANLRGRSLTDFLVDSAQNAAIETIKNFTVIQLDRMNSAAVAKVLSDPPTPNGGSKKAPFVHTRLRSRLAAALRALQTDAQREGTSRLSKRQINAEIDAVRKSYRSFHTKPSAK